MNNSNISVFENINLQMQELHELEMQLTQIDNQLYDILIDSSINTDISSDIDKRSNINMNNNISPDNKPQQRIANRQSVTNYNKSTDNSYLNRYTSIKDPRIMKMRTYHVSDSDDSEYISKVFDMK